MHISPLRHRLRFMWCGSHLWKEWNVFGADLFNEPHAARWADGSSSVDWAAAADRLAETVQRICPRWLIFVQVTAAVGDAM